MVDGNAPPNAREGGDGESVNVMCEMEKRVELGMGCCRHFQGRIFTFTVNKMSVPT
jgi:hypothetical protein